MKPDWSLHYAIEILYAHQPGEFRECLYWCKVEQINFHIAELLAKADWIEKKMVSKPPNGCESV